jgi:protein gp37
MAENSYIQWTDATHNFWEGCKKVSSGCKNCYAERMFDRFGKNFSNVRRTKGFDSPLKWKGNKMIFTCSTSDFFIDVADPWRDDAWAIIKATPQHTYQILTKRPERIKDHLPADWGDGYQNVWLGVSVENQRACEVRIPLLLSIPAKVRFLSCEPLLQPIDISGWLYGLNWVIIGGESGNDTGKWLYRPCDMTWIKKIVDDCHSAGVPVFVKQMGTHIAKQFNFKDRHGGHMAEWPVEFMKRDFPKPV